MGFLRRPAYDNVKKRIGKKKCVPNFVRQRSCDWPKNTCFDVLDRQTDNLRYEYFNFNKNNPILSNNSMRARTARIDRDCILSDS